MVVATLSISATAAAMKATAAAVFLQRGTMLCSLQGCDGHCFKKDLKEKWLLEGLCRFSETEGSDVMFDAWCGAR